MQVVIFPSWLEHFVPPSKQPVSVPRITVSFNAVVWLRPRAGRSKWEIRFE